jgi:pSer/pThr/pTyr-binding forkhead associated (FHA) protein
MDDARSPAGADGRPRLAAYPAPADPGGEDAADFAPLRLLLQSGGLILQFTRPDMVLGRHSEADVRLPLPDVSRKHCRFLFTQGLWQILDLDSLNGVYLNDQPVQRAVLHQGDRLRIGGVHFLVDLTGQASSPAEVGPAPSLADSLFGERPRTIAFPEPRRKAS